MKRFCFSKLLTNCPSRTWQVQSLVCVAEYVSLNSKIRTVRSQLPRFSPFFVTRLLRLRRNEYELGILAAQNFFKAFEAKVYLHMLVHLYIIPFKCICHKANDGRSFAHIHGTAVTNDDDKTTMTKCGMTLEPLSH